MIDPRTIPELPDVVAELESLADNLRKLVKGDNWDDPYYHLFSGQDWEIQKVTKKLKGDVFAAAWSHLKAQSWLGNAEDDQAAKGKLEKAFEETTGLDYQPIEEYFAGLEDQADELALEAIVKAARGALPYQFFFPRYGEEVPAFDTLVTKSTVRLQIYRDGYWPDKISYHARDELVALDKLADIAVYGTSPKYASGSWLNNLYGYTDDASGKRVFDHGPFVACQSFKNGRFDLQFEDAEKALDFAHLLVTGERRGQNNLP